jgi:hypothetical protein
VCDAQLPIRRAASPRGPVSVYEGESVDFSVAAYRGYAHWRELSNSDYTSCNGQIPCYVSKGTNRGSKFSRTFCKAHDGTWFVPIFNTRGDTSKTPPCNGLSGMGTPVKVTVKDGGNVKITWPIQDVVVKVKRGQKYNLSVNAQGAQPIYYSWYSGNGRPITSRDTQSHSVTVGPLNDSACYYAQAWNGGCTYNASNQNLQQGNPFANQDTSANICLEVVDQTDEIQCCLDGKTRTFQITGSSNCKIASIKGYEVWTDLMGNYASDYRHGRIITPEVTSKSNKSWTTKWHQASASSQIGPAVEGVCYNSGTDPNDSQNNQWCSNLSSGGGVAPCFTTSGCPDKIVYEVTTHESTSNNAYGGYFGGSNRNKIIERKQHFEDNPLGQTGHLYVQYASSATYTGDCGCKHHTLNWTFPPYDNGGSSNYASCSPSCLWPGQIGTVCCEMGATIGSIARSFTPNIGQTTQSQFFTGGCLEWTSEFTGSLNFVWSGQSPTGLSSYSRIPGGNTTHLNGYKGIGGADRSNGKAIFTGDVNTWDIKIIENTAKGIEGSGSYDYTSHYLSGSSQLVTFTRTLKDNYYNIRSDSNRTLINLSDYVTPSARYIGGYSQDRKVSLYTAYETKFIFAVNNVDKTDSYSATMGEGDKANGFNKPSLGADSVWCHQSGTTEPFKIYNGWVNICDSTVTAQNSGDCYSQLTGMMGMECSCIPNDITLLRAEVAKSMSEKGGVPDTRGFKYLDLVYVMESGDTLYYDHWEYSGWNSYCHGHFLAVNESTGNWESYTGCAEISPFRTFVNGQEV